ncbi:unnamed protein product, partial [marine sediment metagenome]
HPAPSDFAGAIDPEQPDPPNSLGKFDTVEEKFAEYLFISTNVGATNLIVQNSIIWIIQTEAGKLVRFDPITYTFWEYLVSNCGSGLASDNEGNIWFTFQNSIGKLDPNENTLMKFDVSSFSFAPTGLSVDGEGNPWFIANNKLYKIILSFGDIDSDGLTDDLENTTCTDPNDADTDDDGIDDGQEDANHNGVVDSGETNPCDIDSDDDDIQDGTELGVTGPIADPDGEGPLLGTDTDVFIPDADPSTTTDPLNEDTDGDGVLDGEEDANYNGAVDEGETNPGIANPVISAIDPPGGSVGTQVTLTGEYFGETQGTGFVTFYNDITATNVISWSNTEIICTVPDGAQSGCVTVTSDQASSFCFTFEVYNGTITVNPSPDQLNAPWTITGPDSFSYSGAGDETVSGLGPGDYTLTWGNVTEWNTPVTNPEILNLPSGGSITFYGPYYTQMETLIVNDDPTPGEISPEGEVDWYQFTATEEHIYYINSTIGT